MSDYVTTLANILAQSKQIGSQPLQNPGVSQLMHPSGTTTEGYGQIGQAFGKGIGDYAQETYVQAQKNKYMMENDPLEIEKRGTKFYQEYNNLSPAEQDKVDNWLNHDAEGLKWLAKLQKTTPWMITKVPYEGEIPKGKSADEVTMYRPMRTIPDEQKMKNMDLARMTPGDRTAHWTAGSQKDLAEANAIPGKLANDQQAVKAAMIQAEATRTKAETDKALMPAQADYYGAQADWARRRQPPVNPAGQKMMLAQYAVAQDEIKLANDTLRTSIQNINGDNSILDKVGEKRKATLATAEHIRAIDPLNGYSTGLFTSAANSLGVIPEKASERAKQNMGAQAEDVLERWGGNITSFKDYKSYWESYKRLKSVHWRYFYPEAKSREDAQKQYLWPELKRMSDPNLVRQIEMEEAREKAKKKQLFSTVLQSETYGYGGE